MVAKEYPSAFVRLVDRAKYLSNQQSLHIIFVSNEGSVMPLISSTSSKSRAADVLEIVDVSDEDAVKYLEPIMPTDVARYVVSLTGGRLMQLLLACYVYVKEEDKRNITETIKQKLLSGCVNSSLLQIANHTNTKVARCIMKTVTSQGSMQRLELEKILEKEGYSIPEVHQAIAVLVSANFLRYIVPGRWLSYFT